MSDELSLKEMQKTWHGSLHAYLIGFLASLIFTCLSFLLVLSQILTGAALITAISALAIFQAAFQLRYFLHLGKEGRPFWETVVFFNMMFILLIITLGSLWVMNDLNSRTMSFHHESTVND